MGIFSSKIIDISEIPQNAKSLSGRKDVVMYSFKILGFLYRFVADSKENFILEEELKALNLRETIFHPKIFKNLEFINQNV